MMIFPVYEMKIRRSQFKEMTGKIRKTPLLSKTDKEWKKLWSVRKANRGLYAGNVKGRGIWRKVTNGILGLENSASVFYGSKNFMLIFPTDNSLGYKNQYSSTTHWEKRIEQLTTSIGQLDHDIKRKQLMMELCKEKIIDLQEALRLVGLDK